MVMVRDMQLLQMQLKSMCGDHTNNQKSFFVIKGNVGSKTLIM
jgi:hypothetical protein